MQPTETIQKLDFETIECEKIPFVVINTSVIQSIKNRDAAFLWIYLQSLPPTWVVNKHHIMKHFDISERTYRRMMTFLARSNLIRYEKVRVANGTYGPVKLIVLNGSDFKMGADCGHEAKYGTVDSNHAAKKPHSGESTGVGSAAHINTISNINTKKEIINNNILTQAREDLEVLENPTGKIKPNLYIESTYDTAFKTERDKLDRDEFGGSALPPLLHVEDPPGFNAFFEIYPVKSSKRLARALWWEYKLESKALEIIEKVKQQKKLHVRWKNKEFIPSPVPAVLQFVEVAAAVSIRT